MADINEERKATLEAVRKSLNNVYGDYTKQPKADIKAFAFGLSYDHLAELDKYVAEDVRELSESICEEISKDCN